MTPLSEVIAVINMLKSDDAVFANTDIPIQFAKFGVVQASIQLDFDCNVITDVEEPYVDVKLSDKVIYLSGLYGFLSFITKEHHELSRKAVDFRTINFAVQGLSDRAKEIMKIIYHIKSEIDKTLSALAAPTGHVAEMRSEW